MSHNTEDAARSARAGVETACSGKVRFESFAIADAVAARGRHRKTRTRSAYACGHCSGFHIGNRNMAFKVKKMAFQAVRKGGEDV